MYADDICLLADVLEETKEVRVCEASKVGLRINTRKTEIMSIRDNDTSQVTIESGAI